MTDDKNEYLHEYKMIQTMTVQKKKHEKTNAQSNVLVSI